MSRWCVLLVLVSGFAFATPQHINDLRLGRALYAYHQQHYFDALTELHIAKQQRPAIQHDAQAQLLEGSISLLFGLERHAANTLTSLLTQSDYLDPLSKNTAWLYLARLHHHQGNYGSAARRLDKIQGFDRSKSDELAALHDQRYALMIDIAIRRQALDEAETLLATWASKPTVDWAYAQFNVASALARAGEFQAAANHYARITQLAPVYEVFTQRTFLAIYDKALVNRGYALLRLKKASDAIRNFQQVRLQGDYIAPGLMAWGWAESLHGQPEKALTPWRQLADQTQGYAYRQSALLGVAGLYEDMQQPALAASAYVKAERSLEASLADIRRLARRIDVEPMQNVLQLNETSGFGVSWLTLHSEQKLLVSPWLLRLEASSDFQSLKRDAEAVWAMLAVLDSWQQKIVLWQDVLQKRQIRRRQHQQTIENQQFQTSLQQLQQRHVAFEQALQHKTATHDFLGFVPADQHLKVKRLQRALETAAVLKAHGKLTPRQAQQLQQIHGLLLWQGAENMSTAHREEAKQLAELAQQLGEFSKAIDHLDQLITTAPDVTPFQPRVDALSQQLADTQQQLRQKQTVLEQQLRKTLLRELEVLEKKLKRYLLASRLSLARIYDSVLEEVNE